MMMRSTPPLARALERSGRWWGRWERQLQRLAKVCAGAARSTARASMLTDRSLLHLASMASPPQTFLAAHGQGQVQSPSQKVRHLLTVFKTEGMQGRPCQPKVGSQSLATSSPKASKRLDMSRLSKGQQQQASPNKASRAAPPPPPPPPVKPPTYTPPERDDTDHMLPAVEGQPDPLASPMRASAESISPRSAAIHTECTGQA